MEADSVRSLVHHPAVDVLPDATLRSVAEMLGEESIGVAIVRAPHLPGPGTRAAGIVSERDIVQAIGDGSDPDVTRAEEVMTADLDCTTPQESIRAAALRMLDNEIRHLPVLDGDAVIGVVSIRDALRALLEKASEE